MRKVIVLICLFSLSALAQDKDSTQAAGAGQDNAQTSESRSLPAPEEQEEAKTENPFRIGPYEAGKYLHTNPGRLSEEELERED